MTYYIFIHYIIINSQVSLTQTSITRICFLPLEVFLSCVRSINKSKKYINRINFYYPRDTYRDLTVGSFGIQTQNIVCTIYTIDTKKNFREIALRFIRCRVPVCIMYIPSY